MPTLTKQQQTELVSVINEEFGSDLEFDDFAEAILGLFENISGFETISQTMSTRIVKQLWRKYHGHEETCEES
jgi:hypothetical protein